MSHQVSSAVLFGKESSSWVNAWSHPPCCPLGTLTVFFPILFEVHDGDYWRLLIDGQYMVTVCADGYECASKLVEVDNSNLDNLAEAQHVYFKLHKAGQAGQPEAVASESEGSSQEEASEEEEGNEVVGIKQNGNDKSVECQGMHTRGSVAMCLENKLYSMSQEMLALIAGAWDLRGWGSRNGGVAASVGGILARQRQLLKSFLSWIVYVSMPCPW